MTIPQENFNFWLAGFVDGFGCFSVSARFRRKNKLGIEVQSSFSIAQKISPGHHSLLQEIRDFFKTGAIRTDKNVYKYETRRLTDIVEKIIPFFEKYQLKTAKKSDFILFSDICSRMQKKEHLTRDGLTAILGLMSKMNASGTRRYSIEESLKFLNDNKLK